METNSDCPFKLLPVYNYSMFPLVCRTQYHLPFPFGLLVTYKLLLNITVKIVYNAMAAVGLW